MAKFPTRFFFAAGLALAFLSPQVQAGDGGEPRREFRQSSSYPYTFVPVSYLQTGGPKDMRSAPVIGECAHREGPLLPAATPSPTPVTNPTTDMTGKVQTTVTASSSAPLQPTPLH